MYSVMQVVYVVVVRLTNVDQSACFISKAPQEVFIAVLRTCRVKSDLFCCVDGFFVGSNGRGWHKLSINQHEQNDEQGERHTLMIVVVYVEVWRSVFVTVLF